MSTSIPSPFVLATKIGPLLNNNSRRPLRKSALTHSPAGLSYHNEAPKQQTQRKAILRALLSHQCFKDEVVSQESELS